MPRMDSGARPSTLQFFCGISHQTGAGHQYIFPRLLFHLSTPFIPSRFPAHNPCCWDVAGDLHGGKVVLLPTRGGERVVPLSSRDHRCWAWRDQADVPSSRLGQADAPFPWLVFLDSALGWLMRCLAQSLLHCLSLWQPLSFPGPKLPSPQGRSWFDSKV